MKSLLLITIILAANLLYAQNLVPNDSFENFSSCPSGLNDFIKVENWYTPTTGTSDYYNSCNNGQVGVPYNNVGGFQYARTGYAYVGIYVLSYSSNLREYIQVKLFDSLKYNKKYRVSFFVNKHNSHRPAINKFGLYFSIDSFYITNNLVLTFNPQISYNDFITDTLNWTLIEGIYQAIGGERYITIGNFCDEANTDTIMTGGIYSSSSYYYIDDVYVGLDTTVNTTEHPLTKINIQVFPNPANEFIHVTANLSVDAIFELYDMLGRKILLQELSNFQTSISIKNLFFGLYYYKIIKDKAIIKSGKLLIVK